MSSPTKNLDNEELVPLTQQHSNDEQIDLNDSDDDNIRDTHRSSESTLIADDADLKSSANGIRPIKIASSDVADGPRNLRDGDSIFEEEEGERLTPDSGDGRRNRQKKNGNEGPVGWMSLPHKGQLAVLTIARLSEPLVQTSLQVNI